MVEHADVAVVGGSFAGLTAALMLGRARKRVVIFDEGQTRNRFATEGHGFLGLDGRTPGEMRAAGLADALAYPTVSLRAERVVSITPEADAFRVVATKGHLLAKRVVLAYGMTDVLPDLPGLAPLWGRTANQCPFCHGFELADRPTAVLMTQATSVDHARMIRHWTADLALFANGHKLSDADRSDLASLGIALVEGEVARIDAEGDQLRALVLADGSHHSREVLYLASRQQPACNLAERLGCAMAEGPFGPYLAVDHGQQTSVPGLYAAGDLARPFAGAVGAAASGAQAAAALLHGLRAT